MKTIEIEAPRGWRRTKTGLVLPGSRRPIARLPLDDLSPPGFVRLPGGVGWARIRDGIVFPLQAVIAPVATWTGVNGGGSGLSSPLTSGSQTTTGANLIVVCLSSNVAITGVGDNQGNGAYVEAPGSPFANGGGDQVSIWYKQGTLTVGAGHTVNGQWSGTAAVTLCARAYSGALDSPVDVHTEGTGATNALNAGTLVTGFTNELIVLSGTMSSGSDLTFTGTNGFTTQSQSGQASITTTGFLADQIVTAIGSYQCTATCSQSGNNAAAAVSFKSSDSQGAQSTANFPRPHAQRNVRHSGRYMREAMTLV